MGRGQRNCSGRQATSPRPRDRGGARQAAIAHHEVYAHRNDPEAAPHHRRRRHTRTRIGGDQRCGCREGQMSETPKFGGAAEDKNGSSSPKSPVEVVTVNLTVNGQRRTLTIEPRTTLLDALRENLALTGTKKACDRGECGACTVHIDGRRVLSCMTLAAMEEGKRITTIEGLEQNGVLHPLQLAFIEHDGFQCGFCTSGQIMSGVAMIEEARGGWPSAATPDVRKPFTP